MQLNVPPDLETLIGKRLSSGGYTSVEDVLRRALEAQDAEENWTGEERRALSSHIEEAVYRPSAERAFMLSYLSRPDLTTRSLRFWTLTRYPNYTVVYRPETTPLQVSPFSTGKEKYGAS